MCGLTLGDLLDLLDHCEDPIRIKTAGAGDFLILYQGGEVHFIIPVNTPDLLCNLHDS